MSKSKSKGKKSKFPKKIAGIKVPKVLRKSGGSLAELLETPTGREVVAGALVAVAGSLVGSEKVRDVLASGGHNLAQSGREAGHAGSDLVSSAVRGVAEVATGAVVEAARHVLPGASDKDSGEKRQPSRQTAGRSGGGRRGNGADEDGEAARPAPGLPVAIRES